MANALLDFLKGANASAASTVSAPVDLIAMLLNKAGANITEPVGGSDWMKRKGLMEDPTTNAGYVGNALAGVLPMVAAAKAPQIANALNQAGANALAPRTLNPQLGAVVYHGSPHKFDKFDSSKMGTGEGGQAYGDGLYFAQNKDVANEYAKLKLSDKQILSKYPISSNELQNIKNIVQSGSVDANNYISYARDRLKDKYVADYEKTALTDRLKNEAAIRGVFEELQPKQGNLYKVDLNDAAIASMLDWDKPIELQPKHIQDAVQDILKNGSLRRSIDGGEVTGKRLFNSLYDSESQLLSRGIKGVRYLDSGSRDVGFGTSNFVVFPGEENALRILERNGQALK